MSKFTVSDAGYTLIFEVISSETQKSKKIVDVTIPTKNKNDRNRYWSTTYLQNIIMQNEKNIGTPVDIANDNHHAHISGPTHITLAFELPSNETVYTEAASGTSTSAKATTKKASRTSSKRKYNK